MTREFPAHLYLKPAKADQIALCAPGAALGSACRVGEPPGDVMIISVLLEARPGETGVAATPTTVAHPRPRHDRRPFLPFPPVDGATCYASAEIDTMKPTRIASLLAQTVTG